MRATNVKSIVVDCVLFFVLLGRGSRFMINDDIEFDLNRVTGNGLMLILLGFDFSFSIGLELDCRSAHFLHYLLFFELVTRYCAFTAAAAHPPYLSLFLSLSL